MKKQHFPLLLSLLLTGQLVAQKNAGYLKGGLSFIIGGAKTSEDLTFIPAFTLAPGLRVLKAKEVSLSLEFPASVGISINDDDVFFGVELPATVNLNVGFGASAKSTSRFGWSGGIGKGYHFSYNEYYNSFDNDEHTKLSLWGTLLQTSFFFRDKRKEEGGSVRLYWLSNFSSTPVRKDVIGVSLLAVID